MSENVYFSFSSFTEANEFIVKANQNGGPFGEEYRAACDYIAVPFESARNLK